MSRATKFRLYKTLIRPVACYVAETWALSEMDANKVRIFERRIVRRIYGAVFERDGWRIRNNEEIESVLGNEDIVRYIKAARLRWIGHVERLSAERMQKKIMASKFYEKREDREIDGWSKLKRPCGRWKREIGKW